MKDEPPEKAYGWTALTHRLDFRTDHMRAIVCDDSGKELINYAWCELHKITIYGIEYLRIEDLRTASEHLRKGHATKLVKFCIQIAEWHKLPLILHVRWGNTPAVDLYRKCGFQRINRTASNSDLHYANHNLMIYRAPR